MLCALCPFIHFVTSWKNLSFYSSAGYHWLVEHGHSFQVRKSKRNRFIHSHWLIGPLLFLTGPEKISMPFWYRKGVHAFKSAPFSGGTQQVSGLLSDVKQILPEPYLSWLKIYSSFGTSGGISLQRTRISFRSFKALGLLVAINGLEFHLHRTKWAH